MTLMFNISDELAACGVLSLEVHVIGQLQSITANGISLLDGSIPTHTFETEVQPLRRLHALTDTHKRARTRTHRHVNVHNMCIRMCMCMYVVSQRSGDRALMVQGQYFDANLFETTSIELP